MNLSKLLCDSSLVPTDHFSLFTMTRSWKVKVILHNTVFYVSVIQCYMRYCSELGGKLQP